jgi:hypothetical protein
LRLASNKDSPAKAVLVKFGYGKIAHDEITKERPLVKGVRLELLAGADNTMKSDTHLLIVDKNTKIIVSNGRKKRASPFGFYLSTDRLLTTYWRQYREIFQSSGRAAFNYIRK